jgi:hypothetical protein
MTPAEYSAKAIWHLELAERETDLERKSENLTLALSYMRLAQLAEKNAKTDLVYETPLPATPAAAHPVQQQQQQQQQQRAEREPPEK